MGVLSTLLVPMGPVYGELMKLGEPALCGIGFVAFVVLSVIINVLQQLLFKDPTKPPIVFHYFPFFGSTVIYGMDPYKFFFDCQEKYGDVFTFVMLGRKMTATLGPKGNDFVLNGKLSEVSAEDAYAHLTVPVFGEGVVYDVPNHVLMEQKKFMKFGLTSENFRQYVPLIVEQVEDYIKKSKFFKGAKGSVPLSEIIPELTIFTAARTLQGKEIRDALDGSFAKLYHHLDSGFTPMNFLFPWFPFPQNKRRDHAQRTMAQFYMDKINKRRADEHKDDQERSDMMWNLMNCSYRDGRKVPDKEIAHMMIALVSSLTHPDLVAQILAEQKRVFGDELAPLSYEKLVFECTFLTHIIRETLRMHPPLHSILRKVKSPMHVDGTNWVIPKGHYLLAAPGVSAMDQNYFKDPNSFDPTRWEGQKAEEETEKFDFGFGLISKGTASPYLPFGAGRHRCIGEQFANVQLMTIMATFVRNFEMQRPGGGNDVPAPDYSSMIALPTPPCTIEWVKRDP
ncbi:cytochrome P450 [Choiromyces venosus 120613-1]|uniref:Cytochrome P450 n=1 Tax=Choiromyces venosus 120613-1 TaxID=1336337 RepID=A0A3N4IX56_9PEZI|nr:cytochrome P450 [Choiromyces venosus 120613-1]